MTRFAFGLKCVRPNVPESFAGPPAFPVAPIKGATRLAKPIVPMPIAPSLRSCLRVNVW